MHNLLNCYHIFCPFTSVENLTNIALFLLLHSSYSPSSSIFITFVHPDSLFMHFLLYYCVLLLTFVEIPRTKATFLQLYSSYSPYSSYFLLFNAIIHQSYSILPIFTIHNRIRLFGARKCVHMYENNESDTNALI